MEYESPDIILIPVSAALYSLVELVIKLMEQRTLYTPEVITLRKDICGTLLFNGNCSVLTL
jgi:hypothetical protein